MLTEERLYTQRVYQPYFSILAPKLRQVVWGWEKSPGRVENLIMRHAPAAAGRFLYICMECAFLQECAAYMPEARTFAGRPPGRLNP